MSLGIREFADRRLSACLYMLVTCRACELALVARLTSQAAHTGTLAGNKLVGCLSCHLGACHLAVYYLAVCHLAVAAWIFVSLLLVLLSCLSIAQLSVSLLLVTWLLVTWHSLLLRVTCQPVTLLFVT